VLYLTGWVGFGLLLSPVLQFGAAVPLYSSLEFAVPMAVLLGLQSLSFWYLVQSLPAGETLPLRLAVTLTGAGVVSLMVWLGLGYVWGQYLLPEEDYFDAARSLLPLLVFVGAVGIVLGILGHYLLSAFQRSERRALEMQVLAREAELKSLRAQLDPHFLFNSLNSVAALIGNDTVAARQMCFLMAQFFRKSLTLSRQQSIPLSEEIALVETFLAIERVRFGERLRAQFDVADEVRSVAVPPLVLQPLVENAVHHGVAHLIEGGTVHVQASRREGFLLMVVENPCDPDRPPSRGTGMGIANVRSRIETLCGQRASVDVDARETSFRVSILLPASATAPELGAPQLRISGEVGR
jgi:hypothetical protein